MISRSAPFVTVLILLAVGGCSTFSRDFDTARTGTDTSVTTWQGEWRSRGGHSGGLRCILSETPEAANARQAQFEARFWGLFTAHYTVVLTASPITDGLHLAGDHVIHGIGGGSYHYDAIVHGDRFDATYQSESDQGEFHMIRQK